MQKTIYKEKGCMRQNGDRTRVRQLSSRRVKKFDWLKHAVCVAFGPDILEL